jgi:5-methylcytosine-specific restriction endonuclease McrA
VYTQRTCIQCGCEFVADRATRARKTCSRRCHGQWAASVCGPKPKCLVIQCAACLAPFRQPPRHERRTCSEECAAAFRSLTLSNKSRICDCGAAAVPGRFWCVTCGRERVRINRRKASQRRVRRKLSAGQRERFDPHEIFARDGWKCLMCGSPVEIGLPLGHESLATLDHILPLSRGGGHCRANAATLCWPCNMQKRDSYSPDLAEAVLLIEGAT